jgi:hypothetical protein
MTDILKISFIVDIILIVVLFGFFFIKKNSKTKQLLLAENEINGLLSEIAKHKEEISEVREKIWRYRTRDFIFRRRINEERRIA